ncbi:MAG: HAD-IC family P-type ATPase [Acidimicrobiia bacterium]
MEEKTEAATLPERIETRPTGLSGAEVAARVARGETNQAAEGTSRTVWEIARANIFTRFGAILTAMLALMVGVAIVQRQPSVLLDATFYLFFVANAAIGIVQEVRAKRVLDALTVLNAPHVTVVRDGATITVASEELVLDDRCVLRVGDQVPADGEVLASDGLEIDESLLTGESDPIVKEVGAVVLSGAIVVAGSGQFQVTAVGDHAYARRLAAEVKAFKLTRSELMDGINLILRIATWVLIPVGLLVLWSQLDATDGAVGLSLRKMVAAVVGMVPEGLVVLTSVAFALAAYTLAKRQVLVQELPAVETLARVDVVCLDKTGTLTEGDIGFRSLEPISINDTVPDVAQAALTALAYSGEPNGTALAVQHAFPDRGTWAVTSTVPFSSARKWSAAAFLGHGSWVFGAPEMVLPALGDHDPVRVQGNALAETGNRTLVLAHTDAPLVDDTLPAGLIPVAYVTFAEKIRSDASETMRYFTEQGVTLKVISGDNPRTVGAIARAVGVPGAERVFDARELPEDRDALAEVLESCAVFGRVTPQQKRAMVTALQSRNHTVAMTGDGVNDALALKDADLGIAMGSGAPATKGVAQLVLLDGKFSVMPGVVAEGRRVMANIERAANLFLTKSVYTVVTALLIIATQLVLARGWEYPYLPRSYWLISSPLIGIPGFVLSLAPNSRRYIPGFIKRVLRFAIPAGLIAGVASFVTYWIGRGQLGVQVGVDNAALAQSQAMALLVLVACAFWVLAILARPYNWWRILLVAAMGSIVVGVISIPATRSLLLLKMPPAAQFVEIALIAGAACTLIELVHQGVIRFTRRELQALGYTV